MSLFSCCPKKPKKSLDYIIKWVEDTDKTIEELNSTIQALETWKETIDDNISELVRQAIEDYDWSELPVDALQAKADKVENATEGNLPQFDAEGNLQDSGSKPADFALVGHLHSAIMDASTESSVSIDEGVINIVVEEEGSGGETEINADNIGNLHRALANPVKSTDASPTYNDFSLITSGAVKSGFAPANHGHDLIEESEHGLSKVEATEDDQEGCIKITLKDNSASPTPETATIDLDNIDNLNRALATPSSTPEDDSTKLITSKAVYDALANLRLIQGIYADGQDSFVKFDNSADEDGEIYVKMHRVAEDENDDPTDVEVRFSPDDIENLANNVLRPENIAPQSGSEKLITSGATYSALATTAATRMEKAVRGESDINFEVSGNVLVLKSDHSIYNPLFRAASYIFPVEIGVYDGRSGSITEDEYVPFIGFCKTYGGDAEKYISKLFIGDKVWELYKSKDTGVVTINNTYTLDALLA